MMCCTNHSKQLLFYEFWKVGIEKKITTGRPRDTVILYVKSNKYSINFEKSLVKCFSKWLVAKCSRKQPV